MIVHFGVALDGLQPEPPATVLGEIAVGPARLLDLLEIQLGLPRPSVRPGEALLAYQTCLAEVDHAGRFYHRSFAVDRIGTSRTLLQWRSSWYAAGWRGHFIADAPQRLADMAEVETRAHRLVPATTGERLAVVDEALRAGLATQVERVVLHDELEALPLTWRRVLAHFECDAASGLERRAAAPVGTDLRTVQEALLAADTSVGGVAIEPAELRGDRTFVVVRGLSRDLTAQVLAETLYQLDRHDETVLVAERDGIIIDNALERVGLPRAGFQHFSGFRAVTQVLKLCLGLVWQPASPQLMLQFLLHPVAPLPRGVRSILADAVAKEPGTGGRAWRDAMSRIEARHDDAERLLGDIRFWLEPTRYSPTRGAPITDLIARGQRCATWLAGRLHASDSPERDLYVAAQGQAEALISALSTLNARGGALLARIPLEQLIDEITGSSPDPGVFAQAGHVSATTEPGAVTRTWQRVCWWDLAARPPRAERPWSEAELDCLHDSGVALPTVDAQIGLRTRAVQRPVLNAARQLLLIVHERDAGRHALWSQLASLVRGFTEIDVENELLHGGSGAALAALGLAAETLRTQPLPSPRRWWQLPTDCAVAPRETESYSSLTKLIDYPHEWVLTYAARLSSGRAANLPSVSQLRGTLAHRVLEEFFGAFSSTDDPERWRGLDRDAIRGWLGENLPSLIDDEAATLNQPGMGVPRDSIASTIERALLSLVEQLRAAGILLVAAEVAHDVPLVGVRDDRLRLRGSIDLLGRNATGKEVVIDVKWGGQQWRGEELAASRALQLATYAFMRSTTARTSGAWPEQAYFIVESANLLAHSTGLFRDAVEFAPLEPIDAQQLWRRICVTYGWRREQLENGAIECNVAGTEPDQRSSPPVDGLTISSRPDKFDDFGLLTGWEPGV